MLALEGKDDDKETANEKKEICLPVFVESKWEEEEDDKEKESESDD